MSVHFRVTKMYPRWTPIFSTERSKLQELSDNKIRPSNDYTAKMKTLFLMRWLLFFLLGITGLITV